MITATIRRLAMAAAVLTPALAMAQDVTGAGASFPAPLYSKWADAYNKATGAKINYQSVGSSAGLRQINDILVSTGQFIRNSLLLLALTLAFPYESFQCDFRIFLFRHCGSPLQGNTFAKIPKLGHTRHIWRLPSEFNRHIWRQIHLCLELAKVLFLDFRVRYDE